MLNVKQRSTLIFSLDSLLVTVSSVHTLCRGSSPGSYDHLVPTAPPCGHFYLSDVVVLTLIIIDNNKNCIWTVFKFFWHLGIFLEETLLSNIHWTYLASEFRCPTSPQLTLYLPCSPGNRLNCFNKLNFRLSQLLIHPLLCSNQH